MKTETKTQHTQTPWTIDHSIKDFIPKEQGGGMKVKIVAGQGDTFHRIGSINVSDLHLAEANAAFIVRAVNSHEALLGAVKELVKNLERDNAHIGSPNNQYAIDLGNQAIAAAEGK